MTYHILNGDALISEFLRAKLDGEIVVARECLVEGDVNGDTLLTFWQNRAKYLAGTYNEKEEHYFKKVVPEFNRLLSAPDASEFNLWFGYDLFCRANMWFVIFLLQTLSIKKEVFVVYPSYLAPGDIWLDFGSATPEDLIHAFRERVPFSLTDLELGKNLWTAYKTNDLEGLEKLSKIKSPCFPYLEEVCKAHIDRFPLNGTKGRPERVLEEIMHHTNDFYSVYKEFFKREGIYGFGDDQVKQIYDKIVHKRK